MFRGGCFPGIFVFEPEIDPDIFIGATFHKENDPEKDNEILRWKAECGSKGCQACTNPLDVECLILLLKQLTIKRYPVKYYKVFKSHHPTEMNEQESPFYFTIKHQQNPADNI